MTPQRFPINPKIEPATERDIPRDVRTDTQHASIARNKLIKFTNIDYNIRPLKTIPYKPATHAHQHASQSTDNDGPNRAERSRHHDHPGHANCTASTGQSPGIHAPRTDQRGPLR